MNHIRKSKTNKTIFISVSSCILCSIVFFITGFCIARVINDEPKNESKEYVNGPDSYPELNVIGTYNRTFYNNYNVSVESYVVLKEDGRCKYVSMVASEYAATEDLTNMDEVCSYTYDKETKNGEITIQNYHIENNKKVYHEPSKLTFTYDSGSFMLGGATYYKVK